MKILVNGCFDSFHEGHKHLILKAMYFSCNGWVYLLINSDESVRALKGQDRPVDSLARRLLRVNQFIEKAREKVPITQYAISVFSTEEMLEKIIDSVRPDMIIKGNDRPDTREIIGHKNWPIVIIPRRTNEDGTDISTTNILKEKNES
jgi:D-beta-D-heptose 7-phosphate kinase/D-beta-D-heptose 1-phosphate adenosyltransferase